MELAEIYTMLETAGVKVGDKLGTEVRDAIKAAVHGKDEQEKNLRTRHKTVLEALGIKPDSADPVKDAKAILEGLKAGKDAGDPKASEDYKTLAAKVAELETGITAERSKTTHLKKAQALQAALVAGGADHPDIIAPSMMDKLEIIEESGAEVVKVKVGNTHKTLAEAVADLKKEKPTLFKNPVRSGPGTAPADKTKGNGAEEDGKIADPVERLKAARRNAKKT